MNPRLVIGTVIIGAALALVPTFLNGYYLNVFYQTILFVALAYAWNIISGYAGYFSFGQVAFFGMGAYTTGLVVLHLHWHWMLGALLGGLVAIAISIPAGYLMLRLKGPFFALGMFGLAQTSRVLVSANDATGGGQGLFLPPGSGLAEVYYWTLAIACAAFLLTAWIDRSAFGMRLRALREDEQVAGTLGVNVTGAKIRAFALSAFIPGLLGGGYAWFLTYIEPESAFSNRLDLQVIVMALFGGVGTLWGPLVGGVLMTQISEALWARFPQAYLMIFGGLIVALLIFMPRGIVPFITSRLRPQTPDADGNRGLSGPAASAIAEST